MEEWTEIALIEQDILEGIRQRHKDKTDEVFVKRHEDVLSQLDKLMRW